MPKAAPGWAIAIAAAAAIGAAGRQRPAPGLRFELSFPAAAHRELITGRVYVMISRNGDEEPRLQIGRTGVPFFGRDVEKLAAGQSATIDETDHGTPTESLRDLPPGDYAVQGFINVYSEFKRSDGHTVWMHDDLLEYLKRNWTTLGPKLIDKVHVYTGTMDTYLLNNSTAELEKWMKTTTNPHYEGFFMYGDRKPHCWSGPVTPAERLKEMAQFIASKRPDGMTTPWWP